MELINDGMIVTTRRSSAGYLLDGLLTAIGWLLLFFLLAAGVMGVLHGDMRGPDAPFLPAQLLDSVTTILGYLLSLVVSAALLIGWAKYNQYRFAGKDRRKPPLPLTAERLCTSFAVSAARLKQAQHAQAMVIDHDEQGAVVDLGVLDLSVVQPAATPVEPAITPAIEAEAMAEDVPPPAIHHKQPGVWGMRWTARLPSTGTPSSSGSGWNWSSPHHAQLQMA